MQEEVGKVQSVVLHIVMYYCARAYNCDTGQIHRLWPTSILVQHSRLLSPAAGGAFALWSLLQIALSLLKSPSHSHCECRHQYQQGETWNHYCGKEQHQIFSIFPPPSLPSLPTSLSVSNYILSLLFSQVWAVQCTIREYSIVVWFCPHLVSPQLLVM